VNLYTDPYRYTRAASGHDTSTVIGNLTRIASPGIIAGATSIPLVAPTNAVLNIFDPVVIFDGANSEEVTITATANQGATSLTVSATQHAHAAGTPIAGDGSQGSLPAMIVNASAEIEAYCRQSLLQAEHTNEVLPLRSMRASVSNDYQLVVRPKQVPVTSITGITAMLNASTSLALDPSEIFIDADGQTATLALMNVTGINTSQFGNVTPALFPNTPGWIELSYTAGYAYAALPNDIRQAAVWLVSDLLSDRRNPTGSAELKYGDVQTKHRLAGEAQGRSQLTTKAYGNLNRYRQRAL
jgi:hypothetical protein